MYLRLYSNIICLSLTKLRLNSIGAFMSNGSTQGLVGVVLVSPMCPCRFSWQKLLIDLSFPSF
jgi:hypothetical protein